MRKVEFNGPKEGSLYGDDAMTEYHETSGIGPVWPSAFLAVPIGLCGAVYQLMMGGGILAALLYYILSGLVAFFAALLVYSLSLREHPRDLKLGRQSTVSGLEVKSSE